MITRLKISRSSTGLLSQRYGGLQQQLTPNIILRNALMFSLNNGDKHDDDDDDAIDQAGTEFQISTLLGTNAEIYFMLINEYYKKKLKDDEMKKRIAFI